MHPMNSLLKACKRASATGVATAAMLIVILAMGVSTLLTTQTSNHVSTASASDAAHPPHLRQTTIG
jgi:hypothetical protein